MTKDRWKESSNNPSSDREGAVSATESQGPLPDAVSADRQGRGSETRFHAPSTRRRAPKSLAPVCYLGLLGIAVWMAGCSQYGNAFKDEYAGAARVTTPSIEGVRAASLERRSFQRSHEAIETSLHEGATVAHGPLYFEDPSEEHGSEDGRFAWTSEDYAHILYWRARFMANLLFLPISMIVAPPWDTMESDGYSALSPCVANCWKCRMRYVFGCPDRCEGGGYDAVPVTPRQE